MQKFSRRIIDRAEAETELRRHGMKSGQHTSTDFVEVAGVKHPLYVVEAGRKLPCAHLIAAAALAIHPKVAKGMCERERKRHKQRVDAVSKAAGFGEVWGDRFEPRVAEPEAVSKRVLENLLEAGCRLGRKAARQTVAQVKRGIGERETKDMVVPVEVKQTDDDKFVEINGLASTFGNVDLQGDVIAKGAFAATIAEARTNGRSVPGRPGAKRLLPMLFGHDFDQPIGSVVEMRETDEGLRIKAILPRDDTLVSGRILPQMKGGGLQAFSIGFIPVRRHFEDNVRVIEEAQLLEISVVTLPANPQATITSFKSGAGRTDPTPTAKAGASQEGPVMNYELAFKSLSAAQAVLGRSNGTPDALDAEQVQKALEEAAARLSLIAKARAAMHPGVRLAELDEDSRKFEKGFTKYVRKGGRFDQDLYAKACAGYVKRNFPTLDEAEAKELTSRFVEDSSFEVKDLVAGSGPDGGFTLSADRAESMSRRIFETSAMRQACRVVSTTSDIWEEIDDNDETEASWVGEVDSRDDTRSPTIGLNKIPVHELSTMPKATQKLLDDAGLDAGAWLEGKIADRFMRAENTAFALGNGSQQPRGLLSYAPWADPAVYEPNKIRHITVGSAPTTLDDALLIAMHAELEDEYAQRASWLMRRQTFFKVASLRDADGTYLLDPEVLRRGTDRVLLGAPVLMAQDYPDTIAAAKVLSYGDHAAAYTIVDRMGIRVLRDVFTDKPRIRFYSTKRVGGGLTNGQAVIIGQMPAS